MNKELWIMVLTFLAAAITAASQTLPVPTDLTPWLAFAVIVINLALSIFFGVAGVQVRREMKAKAAK